METSLKFDEIKMNTSLAEKFLRETSEFEPIGFKGDEIGYNNCKNKIVYSKVGCPIERDAPADKKEIETLKPSLLQLAKKIEENIDLFCQLEYLIRKTPTQDVKDFDLKLIIQNLKYYATSNESIVVPTKEIIINNDTPLVSLGYIPQVLLSNTTVTITCTTESTVACWLFTKLCHDVGLHDNVFLNIRNEISDYIQSKSPQLSVSGSQFDIKDVLEFCSGCHGVVTGKCDLDSAVDTFLASTERYPWRIKRIFVQECIIKRFEKAIEWKAKNVVGVVNSSAQGIDEDVRAKCSAAYSCKEKHFLFEYVGNDTTCPNAIIVDTYRTVKELLSLLKTNPPFCLSLWASDVSESNEISIKVDANIVWINDFGNFTGPPRSSQAFFSVIDLSVSKESMGGAEKLGALTKLREAWRSLDITERFDRIKQISKSIKTNELNMVNNSNLNLESFFSAGNSSVCYGKKKISEKQLKVWYDTVNVSSLSFDALLFLIRGGCVLVKDQVQYQALKEIGAPVGNECFSGGSKSFYVLQTVVYKTKVTWTSYGTIFAN